MFLHRYIIKISDLALSSIDFLRFYYLFFIQALKSYYG